MQLLKALWALAGAALCCFLVLVIHAQFLKEGNCPGAVPAPGPASSAFRRLRRSARPRLTERRGAGAVAGRGGRAGARRRPPARIGVRGRPTGSSQRDGLGDSCTAGTRAHAGSCAFSARPGRRAALPPRAQ